jgi:hypothetical protein
MSFVCRVCDSKKIREILDLGMQPWGNDFIQISENKKSELYPLNFVICENCKTSQINYTIPKEKMFVKHSYMSGTTKTLTSHFQNVGEKIMKLNSFKKDDYVMDIGGNDGTFLEFFKEKNIKVLNIDSGTEQANLSNKKGIECINDFFNEKISSEIIKKYGKAKIIHGSGIFFHLEDLKSVFKGIKNVLNNNGSLVAEFIYLPSMIKNLAFDQIYHEHLLYYSLHSFQKLLDQFDLEITNAELFAIHGGSCVVQVNHKADNMAVSQNTKELFSLEKKEGFLDFKVYEDFSSKVLSLKKDMVDLINKIKKDNKKIYALGAPVKGTTLLNFMEFNEDILDCAVEVNKHKFNTFYPGTKIPVLNQDEVEDPDYYLFLSWNFKNEIISKMSNYVEKGGKFIIPFPKVEVQ